MIKMSYDKPVGDQISAPRPSWQQGSAHNILHGFMESAILENPLVGANISGLSATQADLQAILCNCKFWGVNFGLYGLNQKSKNTFCRVPHGEITAKKWLDSIEKQKRIYLKEQRDKQIQRRTDRQSQRQKNN